MQVISGSERQREAAKLGRGPLRLYGELGARLALPIAPCDWKRHLVSLAVQDGKRLHATLRRRRCPPVRLPRSASASANAPVARVLPQIRFVLLLSRQGKVRLAKWYTTLSQKERAKITKEVTGLVLGRAAKLCNFVDWKDQKVVYKRYASLYFVAGIDQGEGSIGTARRLPGCWVHAAQQCSAFRTFRGSACTCSVHVTCLPHAGVLKQRSCRC